MIKIHTYVSLLLLTLLLSSVAGCSRKNPVVEVVLKANRLVESQMEDHEIRQYSVKHDPNDAPLTLNQIRWWDEDSNPTQEHAHDHRRIRVVSIPFEKAVWYFKLAGESKRLAAALPEFEAFLASLRFTPGQPTPAWEAGKTWKQAQPGQFITAKWTLGAEDSVELAVSSLPEENWDESKRLLNFNRWRQQVGLPPAGPEALATLMPKVTVAGQSGWLVDLTQHSTRDTPPVPSSGGVPPVAPPAAASSAAQGVEWKLPADWTAISGPATIAERIATFHVGDVDKPIAKVVVTRWPRGVGSELDNVNRWRGEVGLTPVSANQLEAAVARLEVQGIKLMLSESKGATDRVLAALIPVRDVVWVVKMTSGAELSDTHRQNFVIFLQSLRFTGV